MLENEIEIKCHPYLGYSQNLMEYFSVIGYEEATINDYINSSENELELTILSSLISDQGCDDTEDNLIKFIYPEEPKLILANNGKKILPKPKPSNVVFSIIFDKDDKIKLLHKCYAFKFYEEYNYKDNKYYIPKAFVILSQYPYFTTFHDICENLYIYLNNEYIQMRKNIPPELVIYYILNYIPSPINFNININVFKFMGKKDITLPLLTGYPYIDFDLFQIFNLFKINTVIKLFLLTFIESDMLFFSSNLEILNMIMYIMFILNYPLNDTKYFWHILSLSKNDLKQDVCYVEHIDNCLRGINTSYNEDIDTFCFSENHFIFDIDNEKIFLKSKNFNDKNNEILLNYFDDILNNSKINSTILKENVQNLKKQLQNIKEEYNVKVGNEKMISKVLKKKPSDINFFKNDDNISEFNKKTIHAFYNFILELLVVTNQDRILSRDCTHIEKNINKITFIFRNKKLKLSDQEIIFYEEFRSTCKYSFYYVNFIENFKAMEVTKIPFLFCDEFSNLKMKDIQSKLGGIDYFEIIDKMYIYNPETKSYDIDKLSDEYLKYMNKNNIKINKTKNQLFLYNKEIIKNYLYWINNIININDVYIDENLIKKPIKIENTDIESLVNFIQTKFQEKVIGNNENPGRVIDLPQYLYYSLIYVYAISLPFMSYHTSIIYLNKLILKNIDNMYFFQRHYIFILLKTIHKYKLANEKKKKYNELNKRVIKVFCNTIKSYLISRRILPNNEIFEFLNKIINNDRYDIIEKKIYRAYDTDNCFEINKIGIDIDISKKSVKLAKTKEIIKRLSPEIIYQKLLTIYSDVINDQNFEKIPIEEFRKILLSIYYFQNQFTNQSLLMTFIENVLSLFINSEKEYQNK